MALIKSFNFSNYGGGHKSSASMSALTLLAFLFFLHILQQCIKDHMTDMSTAPVMIMTAGREGDDSVTKSETFNKIDKTGMTEINFQDIPDKDGMNAQNKITEKYGEKNPYEINGSPNKHQLMKIKTTHVTKSDETKHKHNILENYANRSSNYAGFYSVMDEE